MDKWDKSEGNKDKIFDLASKFLEKMDKDQNITKMTMTLTVTPSQAEEISKILKK